MNETTENFLKVMTEFVWPEPVKQSFRLYYNDDGSPKCYSMEELEAKYLEVDAEVFATQPWNVRVVDNKLIFVKSPVTVSKLTPNEKEGICCHPQDVCVVVDQQKSHTKWKITTREIN